MLIHIEGYNQGDDGFNMIRHPEIFCYEGEILLPNFKENIQDLPDRGSA